MCVCVCVYARDWHFFSLFFFFFSRMQGDAKVEGEVSETVTMCFVSAGCMAGWVTDCCVLLWQKRAAACSSGTEAKRWIEWVQVNMLKQAPSVIVLPCWHLSLTFSYFYSQRLSWFHRLTCFLLGSGRWRIHSSTQHFSVSFVLFCFLNQKQ